ncbi:hypothetical protein [Blastococcus mobilis]|uniref:Uncharacterized protein n=1 Tax=Blastococcus mobilis TaxID=1938746 RepID=A0A238VGJ2_9ACTN|nr:hypothetical protein [Blastococcus mobilis]SNR32813.1 hypothetical protein SAMN06272737_10356 [Blastococcus mobilis]
MTPQQAAMVAKTEQRIADRFTELGVPHPAESAKRLVEDLLRAGWRPWPALVDGPPPRRVAPSAVAQAELAKAREVLAEKRGHRPELADGAR